MLYQLSLKITPLKRVGTLIGSVVVIRGTFCEHSGSSSVCIIQIFWNSFFLLITVKKEVKALCYTQSLYFYIHVKILSHFQTCEVHNRNLLINFDLQWQSEHLSTVTVLCCGYVTEAFNYPKYKVISEPLLCYSPEEYMLSSVWWKHIIKEAQKLTSSSTFLMGIKWCWEKGREDSN